VFSTELNFNIVPSLVPQMQSMKSIHTHTYTHAHIHTRTYTHTSSCHVCLLQAKCTKRRTDVYKMYFKEFYFILFQKYTRECLRNVEFQCAYDVCMPNMEVTAEMAVMREIVRFNFHVFDAIKI
jgi:hypothetical protein